MRGKWKKSPFFSESHAPENILKVTITWNLVLRVPTWNFALLTWSFTLLTWCFALLTRSFALLTWSFAVLTCSLNNQFAWSQNIISYKNWNTFLHPENPVVRSFFALEQKGSKMMVSGCCYRTIGYCCYPGGIDRAVIELCPAWDGLPTFQFAPGPPRTANWGLSIRSNRITAIIGN